MNSCLFLTNVYRNGAYKLSYINHFVCVRIMENVDRGINYEQKSFITGMQGSE